MEKGTDDSGWLRTRSRKGKRKRDADESRSDGDENDATDSQSFSQDVIGRKSDMPPPPPRRKKSTTSESSSEPKSRKRQRLADEVSVSSISSLSQNDQSAAHEGETQGGRSALDQQSSEEILRFIELYLVAVGNLMGSIRHLLLADDEQLADFNAAYQRLRGLKEDIVSRMTKVKTPTAFNLFKAERVPQVHEENPTSNITQLTAIIRAQWKALSKQEKRKYSLAASKRAKEEGLIPCRGPGWVEFMREQRSKHQEEGLSRTELLRIATADWQNLSQQERIQYARLAQEKKEAHGKVPPQMKSGEIGDHEGKICVRYCRLSNEAFLALAMRTDIVMIDLTAHGPFRKFSFPYPVGGIPIPVGRKEGYAMSVEGLMEGLKVFKNATIDRAVLANATMKKLKRQGKKYGELLGWSNGLKGHSDGDKLLNSEAARWKILFPAYHYVLTKCLQPEIEVLREHLTQGKRIVLLDKCVNTDVYDYSRPVSAAALLRRYLLDQWPSREEEERLKQQTPSKASKAQGKGSGGAKAGDVHWDSQVSMGDEESDEESSDEESSDEESSDEDSDEESEEESDEEEESEEDEQGSSSSE